MKRFFTVLLVCILLIGVFPLGAYASSEPQPSEVILCEDGCYIEVFTTIAPTRAANTVSGFKEYVCRDSNSDLLWKAKLNATFAYSGGWYTCTTANCNVTIYDSQWYVISNTTTRSSNNAVANLTMGRRYLGVTIERPQYTIKLTCDNNGNLS